MGSIGHSAVFSSRSPRTMIMERRRLTFSTTLENRRLQNMVLNIFKCLHLNGYPAYMKQMFSLRSVSYSLRGSNILSLPKPSTTSYGLNSFCYLASKFWSSLPENYRTVSSYNDFERLIRNFCKVSIEVSTFFMCNTFYVMVVESCGVRVWFSLKRNPALEGSLTDLSCANCSLIFFTAFSLSYSLLASSWNAFLKAFLFPQK